MSMYVCSVTVDYMELKITENGYVLNIDILLTLTPELASRAKYSGLQQICYRCVSLVISISIVKKTSSRA